MNSLLNTAKRAARAADRRRLQGPFKGYIDDPTDQATIRGWVVHRSTGQGNIAVGLYSGGALVTTTTANMLREDVRSKSDCEPACGFQFPMSDQVLQAIGHSKASLTVRPIDAPQYLIGKIASVSNYASLSKLPGDTNEERCWHYLKEELAELTALLKDIPDTDEVPVWNPPKLEPHKLMFSTDHIIPDHPRSGQPAYLDYVRFRYRMDETYQVEPNLEASDRYLYWYLTSYRAQERRRIPISSDMIDYLNAPLVMGGQKFAISCFMWWRLAGQQNLLNATNFNDRDSFLDLLFWWAHQDCPHLYLEDCLVPDRYVDLLRGVHPSRRDDAFPISYFSERFFRSTPQLHFLDLSSTEDRATLAMIMMLKAVKRPDMLRYIPRAMVTDLLERDGKGTSKFERFLNSILSASRKQSDDIDLSLSPLDHPAVQLSRVQFAVGLRSKGFDLVSLRFITLSDAGDRFEAAALPVPKPRKEISDVQIIGPLAKASGLGQATRLSADILRSTNLNVRCVDFDLDNPAPVGFSSETDIQDYGPSKINILHLNAESIPLAFAYQPDVFSGSYNIGYFFWELDTPAICHYLGMKLLDEIWISTKYGVKIYKKEAGDTPVVNVGMCYEDIRGITREPSRAFVNQRFNLKDNHFVCLVAFDSFSFVQRKNPVNVLKAFQQAFKDVPNARLIVKTQNRDSVFDPIQVNLWDQVDAISSRDSRIIIVNETLTYQDMLQLKAGADCYVSLHKSEGWGFGMIEAMNLKVPVVCTAYSGNMEFCTEDTAWLVNYTEIPLQKGDYIFTRRGSVWAEPSVDHAAAQMRAVYDNPGERQAKVNAAYGFVQKHFSKQSIADRYEHRLHEVLRDLKLSKTA